MKNAKSILACFLIFLLSSCLDTEEKIMLNANNSGTYSMTIDLGGMLKMAASMGNNSTLDKVKEKKDTTIYLKDMLNEAANLTAAEKVLYKDAMINIKADEAHNEMKLVMSSPFKNAAALALLKNGFPTVLGKLKAFEKATGEKGKMSDEGDDVKMETKSANPVADQFTFKAAPGKISNTVNNLEAFRKKITSDSTLSMLRQMTSMMGDFNYRTIIILPKSVKKYDGPGGTVSSDKKTVTFFTTLSEMLAAPEKSSYQLEY